MKRFFALVILSCLCCGGGGQDQSKPAPPKQETEPQFAKAVLMVIAPKDFRDEEFKEPYDLFTKSGIKVTVASTDTTPAKGMLGMVVKPEMVLDNVISDSFDAIVIVGGTGCEILWNDTTLHKIVKKFNEANKTIAAICIAPVVLARAEILKDIKATVYPSVKDEIAKCGAQYTGSDVEVGGNIITCSGPRAAADFARTILQALKK